MRLACRMLRSTLAGDKRRAASGPHQISNGNQDMALLTICMPTRRDFAQSRAAIEAAVDFADAYGAEVVLSDNSGDPEKKAYWESRSPRIRYVPSTAPTAFDNFLHSVKAAATPFILQLGDDDSIAFSRAIRPVELASLPDDVMGVRPLTEVTVTGAGVVRRKEFGISQTTPSGRIREYSEKAAGDNSALYSVFRREVYTSLLELFALHHPTKGSFTDWAMALALFAYGRMIFDPSIIYRYNADQWSDQTKIAERNEELYRAAGIPPELGDSYQPLLMALDLFIFVTRPGTPLDRDGAIDAASIVAGDVLNGFLNQVARKPQDYTEKLRYLADLAGKEQNAFNRFQLGLIMADELKPGLKDAYVRYFQIANGQV